MQKTKDKNNRTVEAWFQKHGETAACALLAAWCFLPAVICVYDLVMGALGRFPVDLEGLTLGELNYDIALSAHITFFRVLGVVTVLFVLLALRACWRRVKDPRLLRAEPWYGLLAGLLLWALISVLRSDDPISAFTGGDYFCDGYSSYLIYAGIFVCAAVIRKEKHRLLLAGSFGAVIAALSVIMVVQTHGSPFLDYCFPSRRAVVFNQFNHFGYMLCMGVLAFLGLYLFDRSGKGWRKAAYLAGFAWLVYALLVNDTFGAYLAAVTALAAVYLVYFIRREAISVRVFLPVALLILFSVLNSVGFTQGDASVSGNFQQFGADVTHVIANDEQAAAAGTFRMTLWRDTAARIAQRPVFGFGPEGFVGENSITNGRLPHNEYLQIAGFLGVPALLLYLAALLSLAWHHCRHIRELDPMVIAVAGVSVGYLISACFGNPVFNTAPYLWLFLGLTTATGEKTAPLLCVEEGEDPITEEPRVRRTLRTGILTGLIALFVLACISIGLQQKTEAEYECADLLCMRVAESLAGIYLNQSPPDQEMIFWLDGAEYKLVSEEEQQPAPYGCGTIRNGRALKRFCKEYDVIYSYDPVRDYHNSIIQVTIVPQEGQHYEISIDWVEVC